METRFFEAERTDEGDLLFRLRKPRMFDDETRAHLREARKDMLMAMRSMIDAVLSATERRDEDNPNRRQNIDIE